MRLRMLIPAALACLPGLSGCQAGRLAHHPRTETAGSPAIVSAPSKYSLRVSQFIFLADRELQATMPLFQDLARLREQVRKELELPENNRLIQVYVFEDRERYERYMHGRYPDLPKRRAFFVAQPRSLGGEEDLLVYTFWGERVRQDLRHELTHALLHGVLKDVPLWLDEGLAEFFEAPAEWRGVHYPHLDQIRLAADEPFQPNLARLEQVSQVHQMTPADYREAWAWVHLLLRGKPEGKAILLDYLRDLRTNPVPGPLSARLPAVYLSPHETLRVHLAQLENGIRPASALHKP